jgi:signal transduction histidine kinase/ligand-binding sensor domain-containing protein/AraC-like DNA-binding protein
MLKNKMRYTVSVILFILSWIKICAQDIKFEQISALEGLSQNTVRCILQDKNGFLWFGTKNGLNRYDGFNFVAYKSGNGKIEDNRIKEIYEDKNGFLWIKGYNNKFYCLNPYTNQFIDFCSDNSYSNFTYNSLTQLANGDICLNTASSGFIYLSYNGKWKSYQIKNRTNNVNSLSDDRVNFTFEDSKHNLWIGMVSALGKISSKDIENETFSVVNYLNSQKHQFVTAEEDPKNIYFFTRKGVVIFNKQKQNFEYLSAEQQTNIISAVKFNPDEFLLGTTNKGLLVYNIKRKIIEKFPKVLDPTSNIIAQVTPDRNGGYWVSNNTGKVWRIDSISKSLDEFVLIKTDIVKLIDSERVLIMPDKQGNVWISTYGEGLYQYCTAKKEMKHYLSGQQGVNGLCSNYLVTLYRDRSGNIWAGTDHSGLNKISYLKKNFSYYYPGELNQNMNSNSVRAVFQDRSKNIWIASKDGKISIYNSNFIKNNELTNRLKGLKIQGNVYCFWQDKFNNRLWIGTKGNGVYEVDLGNFRVINRFYREIGKSNTISIDQIYSITQDQKGRLWFATFGGGVSMLDPKNVGQYGFKTYFSTDEGIKQVRCLILDKQNNIWMGTSNGLLNFNPDSFINNPKKYKYYKNVYGDNSSLSCNEVKDIIEDAEGTIWVGTSNGLNRILRNSFKDNHVTFVQYFIQNGLSNDIIQTLIKDKNGNIWIGTEYGLSVFYKSNNTFRNYRPSEDEMSNLISETGSIALYSGDLLFGSENGFCIVNTDNFKPDSSSFPVTLTNFLQAGIPVEPGQSYSVLPFSIFNTKKITLDYTQNSFSIQFATLLFDREHNYYNYILENFDKTWNGVTSSNVATYKNLEPGKYIFKVRYVSPTGNDNSKVTSLEIIIKPPFWKSKVAILIYLIIIVIVLYLIRQIFSRIHKLQNSIVVEKELTEYKIKFFTNISHEFRTPLSLIINSLERINDTIKLTPALNKHVLVMQRNASRLLQLMDQLLDFAKVQNKSMKLHISNNEVIGFVKNIYNNFFDLAEKKEITYHFSANSERCLMYTDSNVIDKVLYNLLSNAFKSTGNGGKIELILNVDEPSNKLTIIVKDNGAGIPEDKQKLIFTRYAPIQTSTTGIGLALSKELVELHHGTINFISKPGDGTEFTVVLSTNKELFDLTDIEINEIKEESDFPHFLSEDHSNEEQEQPVIEALNSNKILIIEDNSEIREYLADYLSKYFITDQAENGVEGLQKAIDWEPDLIICDIVMPEMNGIEVTKKLKSDFQTSHIPILLLTAINSDEKKFEATQAGADEYMTKPFSVKYLLAKVFKLIEQRELLRKRFSSEAAPINYSICKTDKDKVFLEKVNAIAEKQIINPDFSIDDFAKNVGLGRTVFYKKLKGITGYTPNEFIRIIRLKKSVELLSSGEFTVSEVAHKVGMNDPFYFSRCFKAQFGQSPSIYNKGK